MKEIEFDTKITSGDLYHFLIRHFYTGFSGIFGLVLSGGALVLFFMGIGKREPYQLILLLVMASLFTIVQPLQMKMKAYQQIKLTPIFKEPLHYLVNQEGITVSQNGDTTMLPWDGFRKIVETRKAYLLYMTTVNASIIPKEQLGEKEAPLRQIIKDNAGPKICKLRTDR